MVYVPEGSRILPTPNLVLGIIAIIMIVGIGFIVYMIRTMDKYK